MTIGAGCNVLYFKLGRVQCGNGKRSYGEVSVVSKIPERYTTSGVRGEKKPSAGNEKE